MKKKTWFLFDSFISLFVCLFVFSCNISAQVLKYCCTSPRTMEVLLNAYNRLKITEAWVEAVPPEVFQVRWPFLLNIM